MLKTMRASFHHLKWTLFAVIIVFVLGFVFFSGSGPGDADPGSQVLAEVGGERILAAEFDRQYRAQLQQYQRMYQGNFTPQLARAFNLPRNVLDNMVDRLLSLEAARRLRLRVSDEEVAQKVISLFQENGQFIGKDKYEKILRSNGMQAARFEEDLREDMLAQKYRAYVQSAILVPEADVLREFSSRNDKATIEYILVPASRLESAVERACAWLAAMQCSNGGWGAFDKDNDAAWLYKLPFVDFGAVIDPPSADVTAHVVELLAREPGYEEPVRRGVEYLLREQEADGSWFGRWGVNYVYGVGAVLPALRSAGFAPDHPVMRRAVAWLESVQNEDGGFGEDCRSYDLGESGLLWRGRGVSTPSQTAWALLGFEAAGAAGSEAAARAVQWLADNQRSDGGWDEEHFTGTGFPRDFLINYHLYRMVWPIWALGRVRAALAG